MKFRFVSVGSLALAWLALGAAVTATRAQGGEEVPLREPVLSKSAPLTERISYRQSAFDDRGFNRVVDQVGVPTLTLYRPAQTAYRGAAVVICPGGGYQYVVVDREGHMIARYLQQQGITAVVLKYRLPDPANTAVGELPWPQQDALAALRYVRQHASEWGVDARRVGILGCSAGGHLAGSTAIFGNAVDGSRPDFVALLYPVVTFAVPHAHEGSRKNLLGASSSPERVKEYSLESRIEPGMPSFFLVHARDDKAVPVENSEMLAAALRKAEVPVELLVVNKGGHGFSLGRDAESARWKGVFLSWLDKIP